MIKNKSILIVEDESAVMQALVMKLQDEEGYQVFQTKNGAEGLEVALREHPDLILLDIIMPVMDGITMLEKMRKDSWGKKALVILLTNLVDPNSQVKAKKNKVNDYLVKSDWTLEDLIKKIKKTIGK